MKLHAALLAAIVALTLSIGPSARAAETVVWRIGNLDNDYAEFAIPGNYAAYPAQFPNDVNLPRPV